MATGAMTDTSAQRIHYSRSADGHKHWTDLPLPHKSIVPHWTKPATIKFDEASTILMVNFPSNGGTVEVYRNGAKVAGTTSNGGTTFSCILREYGTGNYSVIVSSGNTVIDNKNFTVR